MRPADCSLSVLSLRTETTIGRIGSSTPVCALCRRGPRGLSMPHTASASPGAEEGPQCSPPAAKGPGRGSTAWRYGGPCRGLCPALREARCGVGRGGAGWDTGLAAAPSSRPRARHTKLRPRAGKDRRSGYPLLTCLTACRPCWGRRAAPRAAAPSPLPAWPGKRVRGDVMDCTTMTSSGVHS